MNGPRRRLHRVFLRWLKANRHRFATPLKIDGRTDCILRFSFANVTPVVRGFVSTWEICICAEVRGYLWDLIFVAEQSATPVPGGYICRLCIADPPKIFMSRPALWSDHLFEPLLKWVNDELTPARWLVLEGKEEHWTSARLAERPVFTPDSGPDPIHSLPLRLLSRPTGRSS